jgi:hypothetical protein
MGFPFGQMLLASGGVGGLLMSYRQSRASDKPVDVGPRATRPDANVDLDAVRAGIGVALRTLHSGVLREEVPDRIAALLKRLDQQEADPT